MERPLEWGLEAGEKVGRGEDSQGTVEMEPEGGHVRVAEGCRGGGGGGGAGFWVEGCRGGSDHESRKVRTRGDGAKETLQEGGLGWSVQGRAGGPGRRGVAPTTPDRPEESVAADD